MSNKYTSVYDWLKYIKANVVGINLRELRLNGKRKDILQASCVVSDSLNCDFSVCTCCFIAAVADGIVHILYKKLVIQSYSDFGLCAALVL